MNFSDIVRVFRFVSRVVEASNLLGCGVTGVLHFETARLSRNVGHQLPSGVAPHFRRTKASLSVVIRELHYHVLEMKNVCKIFITNSQGIETTIRT
jgi:hypothetical protein